jgi:vanillate O-demethylase monooxygenase subunit
VTGTPLCRWLLEQRVVLYRTEKGAPVALEDRCAHRWAPLSQGKVSGDEIVCPYHGFRYNAQGACTLVPTQAHVPARMRVRSYPVREHGSFIWIWLGDAAKADPTLLPDIPWFMDPGYLQLRGYLDMRCNYMLIQENVLDLTHVAHLHADTIQQPAWQAPPAEIQITERSVTFVQTFSQAPLAPTEATLLGVAAGKRVNRISWGTFASPACHVSGGNVEIPEPGSNKPIHHHYRSMHCTTPISPGRCHYWWAIAQDFGHQLANLTEVLTPTLEAAFRQDQTVLEAIQTTLNADWRGDHMAEILVSADRAPVEARRILKRMLEAELAS